MPIEPAAAPGEAGEGPALVLTLDGFEGPLDLLLDLARRQKVDLRQLSMLALAEQYLAFIEGARRLEVELAADWLLMAAWLAFLKSGLLLPPAEAERVGAEAAAAALQQRLARLEAMRRAGDELFARPRLGRQVFACGQPVAPVLRREPVLDVPLTSLLEAYARVRSRAALRPLRLAPPPVVTLEEALTRLRAGMDGVPDWQSLLSFLPDAWRDTPLLRSAIGGLLLAALEMARTGDAELRQARPFAPLFVKPRPRSGEANRNGGPAR